MTKRSTVRVADRDLDLSNLDKVMYPATGFTKGQVIDYYSRMARYLLPHLKDRPITMKRFPDGVGGKFFYEKNAPSFTPNWIKTFAIPRRSGRSTIDYILLNDLPSLVWSANMANLEIHPFLAVAPRVDVPTMIVFDLDPGEDANILRSCEVALLVKDVLDKLKLKSLLKVSGSKGIHLHVPLNTPVTYQMTKAFAQSVARLLESEHPKTIVSEMTKAKRKGKVFIDWSQNSEHKSTVAVYSLRAKGERPFVAMPVGWNELKKAIKNQDASALFFEPEAALKRAKQKGDLFAASLSLKQGLPKPFLNVASYPVSGTHPDDAHGLEVYRKKRDFDKTPEPPPSVQPSTRRKQRLFVIQKHAARQLHYDFRLELSGTLKSWAVPKGPPYDLNERRLAMATEDHPMEYANFEGVIPKGEYGGGTVMVWDVGTYELIDGNYWKGKLHISLRGKKLKGDWVFIKGHGDDGKDNAWYLIKTGAAMARPTQRRENSSALSGRTMDQIAEAEDSVWHSHRQGPSQFSQKRDPTLNLDSLPKRRVGFIEPMLARSVSELPRDGDAWMYEIKLDGYRCLIGKRSHQVTLWSRRGNIFTRQFPRIAEACEALEADTLIDGEIVAIDEHDRVSFNLLQHHRSKAKALQFYAFDLLIYQGRSLLDVELENRKKLLAKALGALADPVLPAEAFAAAPDDLIRVAREQSFEGIIAKRKGSLYESGERSGAWVKYRINRGQEFVIGGYTSGNPFDALIVGYYEGDKLMYAAKVRNGFVPEVRRELYRKFRRREIDVCPFANLPEKRRTAWALTRQEMQKCLWLAPELVARIEFAEWTPESHLRHARFAGLRDDKEARAVVRET